MIQISETNQLNEYKAPALTEEQRNLAKGKILQIFGCDAKDIVSQKDAPKILDFEKFCNYLGLPFDRINVSKETFFGADFNPFSGEVELNEITDGSENEVMNSRNHLLNIHTEPSSSDDYESQLEKLVEQLPDPHFPDVEDLLNDENCICEVILRMVSPSEMGVIVLIKTRSHSQVDLPVRITSAGYPIEAKNLSEALVNDSVLIKHNHLAIYRGFVFTPPKAGQSYLRLRK